MQELEMTHEHLPDGGWHRAQVDAEKKGYAGSAVWSRQAPLAVRAGCGLPWADAEGRVVRMDLPQASVLSVYLPSGSAGPERQARKDAFLEYFLPWTASLLAEGRPIVMAGDFNIAHTPMDIHDPKGNARNSGFLPHERAWFDRLLALGWVDLFRLKNPDLKAWSWWSNRGRARENDKGWRIDYVVATPDLAARATASWIDRQAGLSDHAPVCVTFSS